MVPAIVLQWPTTDFTTRMRQNPWIVRRVLELPAEAKVGFWDVGGGVLDPAFGAVPEGGFGGALGGDGEARGGA